MLVCPPGSGCLVWVDRNMINMATSKQTSAASLACLVEDDIPGAQLPRSTPEECSVTQLKRWLLYRAASTTGRKQQLVSRFVSF